MDVEQASIETPAVSEAADRGNAEDADNAEDAEDTVFAEQDQDQESKTENNEELQASLQSQGRNLMWFYLLLYALFPYSVLVPAH